MRNGKLQPSVIPWHETVAIDRGDGVANTSWVTVDGDSVTVGINHYDVGHFEIGEPADLAAGLLEGAKSSGPGRSAWRTGVAGRAASWGLLRHDAGRTRLRHLRVGRASLGISEAAKLRSATATGVPAFMTGCLGLGGLWFAATARRRRRRQCSGPSVSHRRGTRKAHPGMEGSR